MAIFLRGTVKLIQGKAVIERPKFPSCCCDDGITVQFTLGLGIQRVAAIKVSRERIVIGELMNGREIMSSIIYSRKKTWI